MCHNPEVTVLKAARKACTSSLRLGGVSPQVSSFPVSVLVMGLLTVIRPFQVSRSGHKWVPRLVNSRPAGRAGSLGPGIGVGRARGLRSTTWSRGPRTRIVVGAHRRYPRFLIMFKISMKFDNCHCQRTTLTMSSTISFKLTMSLILRWRLTVTYRYIISSRCGFEFILNSILCCSAASTVARVPRASNFVHHVGQWALNRHLA